jgi:hypothetical protein
MQQRGKLEKTAADRKRKGYEAIGHAMKGRPQMHAVEGVAISLFISFLRSAIPNFEEMWIVEPVFDGLESDFCLRGKNWPDDRWVAMQMKSVSTCVYGKQLNYTVGKSDYKNVFVVCVGLLNYTHRTEDVQNPDDTSAPDNCVIGEMWNIGSCKDTLSTERFGPCFGIPYSKITDPLRRLHLPTADDVCKLSFAQRLLLDIETWPQRFSKNSICFEFSNKINCKIITTYQVEKNGFAVVDGALRPFGLCIKPVWRQNECVDYAVVEQTSGARVLYVSAKTATLDKQTGRFFPIKAAPNAHFCDAVIAVYGGAFHKVAVILSNTVYNTQSREFRWNENKLKLGMRVFEDIRTPYDGKAFADYLLSLRAPVCGTLL